MLLDLKFLFVNGLLVLHLIKSSTQSCETRVFDGNGHRIDCEHTSLQSLRSFSTTGVQSINISSSWINTLPSGIFDSFNELRRLHLSHNVIEVLEYGAFSAQSIDENLRFLQVLDLSFNKIATLKYEIFNHSFTLNLNLTENGLTHIELGAFKNMHKLKKLDLSFNQISSPYEEGLLPIGIFQDVPTMNVLNLSHNSLKKIHVGTFTSLPFLSNLDLSHNDITHLSSGVFSGTALIELLLNDNSLVFFEYPNVKTVRTSINLVNNDFECDALAKVINELPSMFFVKGNELTTTNIHGIHCDHVENDNDDDVDTATINLAGELTFLKYVSISTLLLGLLLSCYVFFCNKKKDVDDEDNGVPILKEVTFNDVEESYA